MVESLRARLLLWHTLLFSLLIVLYAGTVTYVYWQSLVRDVDTALATTAATMVRAFSPDPDEPGAVDLNFPPQFVETEFLQSTTGAYYIVWNGDGQIVDQSDGAAAPRAMPPPGAATVEGRRELVIEAPGPSRILVGRRLDTVYAELRSLGLTIGAAGGAVLLLSLAAGSFLAGRALAPIARINRTAGAMVGGDLDARIPVHATDSELEHVARALNEAFDRMHAAAEAQRHFTADASHELRTPLATLRAEFDWALLRPRSEAEYRASIVKGQQAVERLTQIANRLLTLLTPSAPTEGRQRLDLAVLLSEVIGLITPRAKANDIRVQCTLREAFIKADRSRLADAFSNLLKNAVEYNQPGGEVSVLVSQTPAAAEVTIRDTGIGISAEDLPRIFERFYRADRSRNRQAGGAGLGLAIVKQTIEQHGGTVTVTSTPGAGTEFVVRLPLADRS